MRPNLERNREMIKGMESNEIIMFLGLNMWLTFKTYVHIMVNTQNVDTNAQTYKPSPESLSDKGILLGN